VSKVTADENQLELALLNLCVNARDAMKDGGQIVISAARKGPARIGRAFRRQVCLSLRDR
jgi:signal transduction histidine kinase